MDATDAASETQPRCELCRDTGVARDSETASAEFCTCACGEALRERTDAETRREATRLVDDMRIHLNDVLGRAQLPERLRTFTLKSFPVLNDEEARATDQALDDWLAEWDAETNPRWLLLTGGFGSGKTGRAVGVMKELIARMGWDCQSAAFVVASELVAKLYMAMHDYRLAEDLRGTYWNADILILDDVGADYGTGWTEAQYFDLINFRYDAKKMTIITTNLSPVALAEHLTERVLWRVMEHCGGNKGIIAVNGINLHDPEAVKKGALTAHDGRAHLRAL